MYDYDPADKGGGIINAKGELDKSVKKQVILDGTTINTLNKKLGQKQSYGGGQASCFDPHFAFVYYLKNKPVAEVMVCFSCNKLISSLDIPAKKQGKTMDGNDNYYLLAGMSKSFRKYLNALISKHGFSNTISNGSIYD